MVLGEGSVAELWTASVEDGVLDGTVRQVVLQTARLMSLPVIEEAPKVKDKHDWSEAFLTNRWSCDSDPIV